MKLYLSSMMIGDHADRLVKMAGGPGSRMAILTNALDHIPLVDQQAYTRNQFDPMIYFGQHGFDPSIIDLRHYFGRRDALKEVLARHQVIWSLGGNAFLLRRAMRDSGFDESLTDLLRDGLVYSGWSAGACVAGASLRPIALMDDPHQAAPGYPNIEPVWEGLGLVPVAIVPHYRSDHPETEAAERAITWAAANEIDAVALQDGEVMIRDGGETEVLPATSRGAHVISAYRDARSHPG